MADTNQSIPEVLKKVEDQITCSICMKHFTDPRVLSCFHSYCLTCLQRVLVEGNNYSLPCPTCQTPCPVPDKGLASLPPSFVANNLIEVYDRIKKASAHQHVSCDNCDNTNAISYCKQCDTFLCPECFHHHNKWKPNTGHQILSLDEVASTAHQLPRAKQDLMSCTDHNKPLDLFCESCQQLICHDCTVSKHEKPLHKYVLVTDTYRQRKDAIDQSCLQPLNEEYDRLVAAQKKLTVKRDEIPQNAQATKDDIWQAISQIKNRLDETGKQLTQKVDSVAQYKVEVLDQQLKEVDTALGQVAECIDQCVNVGSPQQVLLTTPQIMSHTQSVIDSVKDQTFQPLEQPDIQLVKSDTIPQIHKSIGEVKYTFHPAKVTLSRRHIPLINQESTITIALSVPDGSPAPVPPSLINCRLTPPDNSPPMQCSVKESSQPGQYSVVFTPLTRSIHQLHITVNCGNIPGSPVSVPVSVPSNMRGTPVKTISTGLNRPMGVAVTDDGLVIVSEAKGHCITILDSEGRKIRSIGTRGEGRGQLRSPQGVAITSKRTILVADLDNHCIQEFTMEGDCVSCVGSKGTGPLQFNCPRGITINKTTGQVFVADTGNHRVQVLHPDLTFSHMFGSKGSSQGQFNCPYDVAIDSQGYVYVTDRDNHRVQQFTPEGQPVSSFGTEVSGPGQLYYPTGITLDDNDLVYVNNNYNQFISVYNTNGQYITRIEKRQPYTFYIIQFNGITHDSNGYLYSCCYHTNEVVKIADFGVAEELDPYSQSDVCTTWQGSPAFQPPEVASGQGPFQGFKADVWSAGVTLYHFATGKFPFEGETLYKLFHVITIGDFTIPPDLPPLLQNLIKGMLSKDVNARLYIPQIKNHQWLTAKHAKPLREDIVRFPPYPDSDDPLRGTTVLPYLESFYNYGGSEGQEMLGGRWDSQEESLFDVNDVRSIPSASQSLASVSHERSMDTVSMRRSRIPSQENVLFPTSRSVDELGVSSTSPPKPRKKRKSRKNISEQCSQQ